MGGIPSSGYVEEDRIRSADCKYNSTAVSLQWEPYNDIHGSPSDWLPPTLSDSSPVGAESILVQYHMLIETNNV